MSYDGKHLSMQRKVGVDPILITFSTRFWLVISRAISNTNGWKIKDII